MYYTEPKRVKVGPAMVNNQSDSIFHVKNLSRHFCALKAVDGVSLSIDKGERRALIGPNGAGKTTLFNVISGELEPTSGEIYLKGRKITRMPSHQRVRLGLGRSFQVSKLFPQLTVFQNLILASQGISSSKFSLFSASNPDSAVIQRAKTVLENLELRDQKDVLVSTLSHGEKRQLEIAMGLASDPEVLLLDEPAAGLATSEREIMFHLIENFPDNLTFIMIEHDLDLALKLVDRVTCMHYGSVIAEGDPEQIQSNPKVQNVYLGSEQNDG